MEVLQGEQEARGAELRTKTNAGYKLSIFGRPIATLSWNYKFGNYASD
jgi:hypothetical protein